MASNPHTRSQAGQAKRTSFSGFAGGTTSILMEKAKASIRGSTPDSEAMASSDDEQEHYHRMTSFNSTLPPKPIRRSSWLTETHQAPPRKGSMSGNGNFSPSNSQPSTPSGDPTGWGAGVGQPTGSSASRGHSNSASFPWGSAIWSNDSVKAPPSRLSEVLVSSTGLGSGLTIEEALISPPLMPLSRDNMAESSIPFAIPLHPTIKNYRSQSYSVGQMDPEPAGASSTGIGTAAVFQGRARGGNVYTGLQRRLSRPSMLNDMNRDAAQLGQLREVEDDVDSSNESEEGVKLNATQALTIEKLAMENAMLRQAAAKQIETTRTRNRTATGASAIKGITNRTSTHGLHQRIQESVPEELDSSYDENDIQMRAQPYASDDMCGRRYSEYATNIGSDHLVASASENQTLENVRKAQWQSSLGFGGLAEPPQSRRHSFADIVSPRHASIGSGHQAVNALSTADHSQDSGRRGSTVGYDEGSSHLSQVGSGEYAHFRLRQNLEEYRLELEHLRHRDFAASYFSGPYHRQLSGAVHSPSPSSAALHPNHMVHNQYARPLQTGPPQLRPNQLLYVVTFKACRAEIFYVQEGTGLYIKAGDLVIVEADRGMDLGTVAQENIPWSKAKEYRDHYVEEHYRWLMMFSRQGQTGASGHQGMSLTSSSHADPNVEGMGRGVQTGAPDTPSTEIKPKMIKRLAQAHEIQILKDKEGNEAKAKRICQQKVLEHRLDMEILDAEFQMDWKKLTFYYFADAYINFNTLVTDLFKIYKTRIWMSAINPASFVSSAVGLQLPSGLGPGAFTGEHENHQDYRQPRDVQMRSSLGAVTRTRAGPDHIWAQSSDTGLSHSTGTPLVYMNSFQPPAIISRPVDVAPLDYRRGGQHSVAFQSHLESGGYPTPMPQPSTYLGSTVNGTGTYRKPENHGIPWSSVLQGLSLDP